MRRLIQSYPKEGTREAKDLSFMRVETFAFLRGSVECFGISIKSDVKSFTPERFLACMDDGGYFITEDDMAKFRRGELILPGEDIDIQFNIAGHTITFRETVEGKMLRSKGIHVLGSAGSIMSGAYFPPNMVWLVEGAIDDLYLKSTQVGIPDKPSGSAHPLLPITSPNPSCATHIPQQSSKPQLTESSLDTLKEIGKVKRGHSPIQLTF